MHLIYRGQSYRLPVTDVSGMDTGLRARFRGISYRFIATRCEHQSFNQRHSPAGQFK